MWVGKLLIISALAASASAQLTNTTLLGILNTTQLSPANKFMEVLTSDSSFKPILDLLSSPGKHTVFIPTDQALKDLSNQSTSNGDFSDNVGPNNNTANGGSQTEQKPPEEGGSGSEPPPPGTEDQPEQQQTEAQEQSQEEGSGVQVPEDQQPEQQQQNAAIRALYAMIPRELKILQSDPNGGTGNMTTGGNFTNVTATTVPFKQGPYANLTAQNLLQYHVVNGSYLVKDLNDSSVLNTLLNNRTLDKNGVGLPIVINQLNITTNDNGDDQEQQQQQDIQMLAEQQDNSTTPAPASVPKRYVVGNGVDFANITIYDIEASNGVLHFIDRVLIPPGKPTDVIQNVSEAHTLAQMVEKNESAAGQINNAHNITVLVPSDEALSQANLGSSIQILAALNNLDAQPNNVQQLVKNHIFQGVYYINNMTVIANRTTGGHSIKNMNNASLPLTYVNATSVRVNNTATVIDPNILMDNGVMHVIDHVLGQ
ncbi:FAS1 domain-containing protein [Phascolomyces articulosus]|uniref:FAS1 domain-containing protein n=1 Tax=Phascolomyces articulosus TaxID=60185 RepID=A0AAD5PCI8_9FUNG|nr:FAS1 domain-containing protein [Phascolomyces articulosus]